MIKLLLERRRALFGFIIASALLIIGVPLFITIVDAGEVGVLSTFGNVSETVFRPGIHLKNPFTNVIEMNTRTQEYTMSQTSGEGALYGDDSIQALASDGASIWLDVTVFYRLEPTTAPDVYSQLGLDYDQKIIRPEIRSAIRKVVSQFAVNEIYSTKREEIQNKILEDLTNSLQERGIITEDVLLRRVNLSEQLFQSIELKLTAQQKAQQKEFEIEEAKKEAERKRIEAEGEREAQRIINETLSDKYLYYLYVQNLENNPNVIYVPTEGGLPLFRNIN
ncbi:prohibitin family protein [Candidatus Dojkabacteria bacterium]|uniref:Prohibitin family protein n=1 Tax=Candidatus Dojkabacteria bacterium TaxID=2099670 RepID=A0A955L8N6_9BACT|nr:prohibitin family protein [Candidatus Dojkabacteria bacterium]